MKHSKHVPVEEIRPGSDEDPGTPDDDVPEVRREGRRAYRLEHSGNNVHCPYPKSDNRRVGWWLGYLDERLKRFYGRI